MILASSFSKLSKRSSEVRGKAMQQSLSIGLSSQITLLRRLDTIANNVANQSTAGFRAEEVTFSSIISKAGDEPVAFASTGKTYTSQRPGGVVATGNQLDIAVSGDAWFAIRTPEGNALTRDGRLKLSPSGELQTTTGYPLLDVGGSPVQVTASGGAISVARNGTVSQGGQPVGAIGLFLLSPDANIKRVGSSGIIADIEPVPSIDPNGAQVLQGYIEQSNVEPVREMARLIELQRRFDAISAATSQLEGSFSEAIRAIVG